MDLLNGALPMGMVFFGIMVFSVVRRKAGNVVARTQYPKLGAKLGMSYTPSPYKSGVGKLQGNVEGYQITVDPDDQRRIYLRFDSKPLIEMHNFVHNKRSPAGMSSFRPASPVLSAQFRTAHASAPVIARLNSASLLDEVIKPFKFLRPLKQLSATENGITATFDYGSPPYIPAEVVDDVIARLVALARVIEGR